MCESNMLEGHTQYWSRRIPNNIVSYGNLEMWGKRQDGYILRIYIDVIVSHSNERKPSNSQSSVCAAQPSLNRIWCVYQF